MGDEVAAGAGIAGGSEIEIREVGFKALGAEGLAGSFEVFFNFAGLEAEEGSGDEEESEAAGGEPDEFSELGFHGQSGRQDGQDEHGWEFEFFTTDGHS